MSTADQQRYIGIEIEGATIRAALVDHTGQILDERTEATRQKSTDALTDQLINILKDFHKQPSDRSIAAAGIGVPGLVNLKTNSIVMLTNLPQISTARLCDDIKQATGVEIIVDNDANVGAYGEWQCGIARGYENFIYITIGTGVGAGIMLGGRMWRGTTGFAGEVGHMTINVDGQECVCGNVGCLETVASGPNIVRRTQQRLYRDRTSSLSRIWIPRDREMAPEDIVQAALSGDELSQVVFERTGRYLGIAVGGLINLINPGLVVFGGKIMKVGKILLDPIIEETRQRAFRPSFESCRIVASQLGANAGVIGAALLARDTISIK